MQTKQFSLGQVLTVLTGRVLCPVDDIYEVLNFMTQDNLFTHQLGRAMDQCSPYITEQFPELSQTGITDEIERFCGELQEMDSQAVKLHHIETSLQNMAIRFNLPLQYDVMPIPGDDQVHREPIQELVDMVGKDRVIVAETGDEA